MDVLKELSIFKKKIDREMENYFSRVISETKKVDLVTTDSLRYVKKIMLAGGKRLRPAMMYYGYLAAGGGELEKILKASISVEFIHTFLLIHDDIIDCDGTRHGVDSVNAHYEKIGKRLFWKKDSRHFGNSMAIIIGDMIGAIGGQIIFDSKFDPKLVMKALSKLQSVVSYTVVGQSKDIYIEYKNKATEREILEMYEYKTAKYTLEGPLHLGAILAGADEKFAEKLSSFAIPMGVAFQIQDDILGIFGSEKKIGKKVGSDIAEGKFTLLVAKAREKTTKDQNKFLDAVLGRGAVTKEEVEKFREIIIQTGALDYARDLAELLINRGKKALQKIEMKKEAKDFFESMADYMIKREL